jgi:chloramphenicol 3-O phosphotransferase
MAVGQWLCFCIRILFIKWKVLFVKNGKIIYLNGVTSTGKTTLTKAIQQKANENFYHLSNDMFQIMVSEKYLQINYWKFLSEAIIAMYYTAKALSDMNINVIIDGMLVEEPEFQSNFNQTHYEKMKSIFADSPIIMIEVFCPLEECRRRNIERGDRKIDQSDWQNNDMSKNIYYDFSVDTSINNPEQCAELILNKLYINHTV